VATAGILNSGSWFPGVAPPPDPLAYHFSVTARYGLGLALTVLVVPALAFGLFRGGPARLIAITCLGQIAKLAASPTPIARYALPVVPGLLVLIAVMVVSLWDRIPWPVRWRSIPRSLLSRGLLGLFVLLLVVEPAWNSTRLVTLLSRPDTRERAGAWIAAHLPQDAVVLSWGAPQGGQDWGAPPMGGRRVLRDVPAEQARALGAGWLVRHQYPFAYSGERLAPVGRLVAEFSPYTEAGVRPVVEPLDAFYLPVGNFGAVHSAGPRITIYDLAGAEGPE
jgi:hypothetical protein